MWPFLQNPPEGCNIDFVRGELSSRWTIPFIEDFEKKVENTPQTRLLPLEKAGHWMVRRSHFATFSLSHSHLPLARR